jgi:hypothetical protein
MLQIMDLAKENVALRCELERVWQEAEALHRLLSDADGSAQTTADMSAASRFWQIITGATAEKV